MIDADKKKEILALFGQGLNKTDIARRFGCSFATVLRVIVDSGVDPTPQKRTFSRQFTEEEKKIAMGAFEEGGILAVMCALQFSKYMAWRIVGPQTKNKKEPAIRPSKVRHKQESSFCSACARMPVAPKLRLDKEPSHFCIGDDVHRCHYPLDFKDDRGLSAACGEKCKEGSSYCKKHHAICYSAQVTGDRKPLLDLAELHSPLWPQQPRRFRASPRSDQRG